ncbi:unnamed protein product [Trifolium pratense]|uniref:Uncharacterized protein n=1 Tax=Trifolium pratense TaxID=57577 RepID=A0ACB0KKZ2_TRIPR|nr:unnamed protein product [Trifolium pratense]
MFIQQETFQTSFEETNLHNQTCVICQEDYADGERIGRIRCMHTYHLDCIKQWLMQKNVCPICQHTALEIGHEDEDES